MHGVQRYAELLVAELDAQVAGRLGDPIDAILPFGIPAVPLIEVFVVDECSPSLAVLRNFIRRRIHDFGELVQLPFGLGRFTLGDLVSQVLCGASQPAIPFDVS